LPGKKLDIKAPKSWIKSNNLIGLKRVILGHSMLYSEGYISDIATVQTWVKRFSFQVVTNGFFSVDSFFMIRYLFANLAIISNSISLIKSFQFSSGLLTAYLFLKEMDKRNGDISLGFMAKFYIHRFWR
jgi:hypothetical protein